MLLLVTGASGVGKSTCRIAIDRIAVCLLDCDAASQTERLRRRGEPEELLRRHVAFADWMREHVRGPGHMPEVIMGHGWDAMRWERLAGADWSFDVIDTSGRAAADVAADALAWVRAARSCP